MVTDLHDLLTDLLYTVIMHLPCQTEPLRVAIDSNYDLQWWLTIGIQTVVPLGAAFLAYWFGHHNALQQYRAPNLEGEIAALEELVEELPGWVDKSAYTQFAEDQQPAWIKDRYKYFRGRIARAGLGRFSKRRLVTVLEQYMNSRDQKTRITVLNWVTKLGRILSRKRALLDSLT